MNKKNLAFLIVLALPSASFATENHIEVGELAETFGCIQKNQASDYVRDFNIQIGAFGGEELCNEKNHGKMLLDSIWDIESARFSTPQKTDLQPDLLGTNYYDYFRNRVKEIVHSGCNSDKYVMACVYYGTSTMHVEDRFFNDEFTSIDRASTLIHEARHVEGYSHVDCKHGVFKSIEGGCDPDMAYKGSYAVEIEYLSRVALDGENFHPAVKVFARMSAADEMDDNFNSPPSTAVPALFLIDDDTGHVSVFDGKNTFERRDITIRNSQLVSRLYGLTVIPNDRSEKAFFVDPYSSTLSEELASTSATMGSTLIGYNKTWSIDQRRLLLDIFNSDEVQARLYSEEIQVSSNTDKKAPILRLDLSALHPEKIVTQSPCDSKSATDEEQILLRTQSNQIYKVAVSKNRLSLSEVKCDWPADLRTTVNFKGEIIGLMTEGELVKVNANGSFSALPGFQGRRFSNLASTRIYPELIQH